MLNHLYGHLVVHAMVLGQCQWRKTTSFEYADIAVAVIDTETPDSFDDQKHG